MLERREKRQEMISCRNEEKKNYVKEGSRREREKERERCTKRMQKKMLVRERLKSNNKHTVHMHYIDKTYEVFSAIEMQIIKIVIMLIKIIKLIRQWLSYAIIFHC